MSIPNIIIAGTNSGCGKTTLTISIMAALRKRNLTVQSFKIGPDYLDTKFHSFITNRSSRNLDAFLFDENTLKYIFGENSKNADISICEGVMGLYDGVGDTYLASTAYISKILKSPIIIIVNAKGMALSIVPIIKGFIDFDRDVYISGVILNNVKSEIQYNFLKDIINKNIENIEVLGYFKENVDFKLESRHLGLINAFEVESLKSKIDIMAEEAEKTLNINRILEISNKTSNIYYNNILDDNLKNKYKGLKIGIAYDKAFNFYYKDNIDLLEFLGIEIIYFSILNDRILPNVDALYIGGGYPEIFAYDIEKNNSMRESIKIFVENNGFVYAECGGLIYMTDSIQMLDGKKYKMSGVLDGYCKMTNKLNNFGYVTINNSINAHEFHYSIEFIDNKTIFDVSKKRGNKILNWKSGYTYKNLLASYPHIHFYSNIDFVLYFIEKVVSNA